MKVSQLIAITVGLQVGVLSAADVFVGAGREQAVHVEGGQTETFSGRMVVSDEGSILKTGLGAWTLPGALLLQNWDAAVTVAEGAASFWPAGKAESENPAPDVLGKALIWVSAKDPDSSHFDKSGDALNTWYDVRETDVANAKYLRAVADHTHATDCPTVMAKDGFESVYFGGLTSGKAMKFYRPGSTTFANFPGVHHIFAVVGNYASQGAVFGSGTSEGEFFYVNLAGIAGYPYANASLLWPSTYRSRVYVNGVRFDAYAENAPARCFHLLDVGGPVSGIVGSFYAQAGNKSSWGGDYLAEAIAFTNELSEAERVQVASYLTRKWFGTVVCDKNVRVAKDASVALDATSGDVDARDVNLSGDGQLVKKGSGTAFFRAPDAMGEKAAFAGNLKIEAGAVDLSTDVPVGVAAGGELATATSANGNRRVTVTEDNGAALVKSGVGEIAITSVPSSVNTLTVSGGALDIRPSRTGVSRTAVRKPVALVNPSFETFATDAEWMAADGVLGVPIKDLYVFEYQNGWRRCNNAVRAFNFDKWLGTGGIAGATHDAWGIKRHPHDGNCAAWIMGRNAILATPVTIIETGIYEVALDVYSLEAATYLGGYATVSLMDTATRKEVANFGRIYAHDFSYRRVALTAEVAATGSFELQLHLQNEDDGGHYIIVDNFELNLLPEVDEAVAGWPVPGGDFEYDETLFGAGNRTRVTTSPIANVSLDQGSGRASIVTFATREETESKDGVECNGSRIVEPGFRQLQLAKGACSATLTATPKAGTYLVRAAAARYYQFAGAVTATVRVGTADPVSLGTRVVSQTVMRDIVWPTAFTVDGSTAVTITFAFARSEDVSSEKTGVWLDDVRLIGAAACNDHRNYLVNGDFEAGPDADNWAKTGWAKIEFPSSQGLVQPYHYRPDLFSADPIDGTYYLYLERGCGATQTVDFDRAGVYRLSFHAAVSRRVMTPGEAWWNACTPIRAWLAQGGTTNVIGTTTSFANTNYVQTVWDFKIPAAGSYVFGLQGTAEDVKYSCANACIDAISIRRLDGDTPVTTAENPILRTDAKLSIAKGAKLRLTFEGVNKVDELRLGGRRVSGLVNAQTHPDYIEGMGELDVDRKGMAIIVR